MVIIAVQESWFRNYLNNGLKQTGYLTYPVSSSLEAMNLLSVLKCSSQPARLLILDSANWNTMAEKICQFVEDIRVKLPILVVDLPDGTKQLAAKKTRVPDAQLFSIDIQKLAAKAEDLLTTYSIHRGQNNLHDRES